MSKFSVSGIQEDWKMGLTARQIAAKHGCSESTARKYRPNDKLLKPTAQKTNSVTIVIDESGSMDGFKRVLPGIIGKMIKEMHDTAKPLIDAGIKQVYNMVRFGHYITDRNSNAITLTENLDPLKIESILSSYQPFGGTPLCDATNTAIVASQNDTTRLVIVLTDGDENRSTHEGRTNFARTLANCPENLTVAFLVPGVLNINRLTQFGVPRGNINVWDTSSQKGLENATESVTRGYGVHTQSLLSGATQSANYFAVDLGGVKTGDVKKELELVTDFKVYYSPVDEIIRPLVEKRSKKPYVPGNSYYELAKTERVVHAGKKILVRDPVSGKVYGGNAAREKLGLPTGTIKMKIGDHGKWQIFVQSKSVNRTIPAGTRVITLG